MLYQVCLAISGIRTHNLVVIGTDCTGCSKSNNHKITTNEIASHMNKYEITCQASKYQTEVFIVVFNMTISKEISLFLSNLSSFQNINHRPTLAVCVGIMFDKN